MTAATNWVRCPQCSTRTTAVMVHPMDWAAHREDDRLNARPCCSRAPHAPEVPHYTNTVAQA